MNENLGLVCLLSTQTCKNAFNGIKSALSVSNEVLYNKCKEATIINIQNTIDTLHYCHENNIKYNRITSSLIPFDDLLDWEYDNKITEGLQAINKLSIHYNIELTIHPSQFAVLSSDKKNVIENTKKILDYHYKLCKYIGIKHIILHVGSAKEDCLERFIDNYMDLNKEIQDLIRLENCKHHSLNDVLLVSDLCGVDVVYDLHHQILSQNRILTANEHRLNAIRTMSRNKNKTICHISTGKSNPLDNSHADYISDVDYKIYSEALKGLDVVIEVEAKAKENAILQLKKTRI